MFHFTRLHFDSVVISPFRSALPLRPTPSRSFSQLILVIGKLLGKDRFVCHNSHTIGVKKILVFHVGRTPCGERTNWAMHEYKLEDRRLANLGISQDAYVLCRLFTKSGSGPKNGEQYGAPLKEDEWEDATANVSSLFIPLSSPGPPLDHLLLKSVPQPVLPGYENLANHPLDFLDTEKMILPHFSDNADVVSKLLGHTSWEEKLYHPGGFCFPMQSEEEYKLQQILLGLENEPYLEMWDVEFPTDNGGPELSRRTRTMNCILES